MAPVRRYLRITKYSVLEVRIYLDNPSLAQSWLLHPRDPILPKVMEAVRPLVLPKLEEEKERERNRRKGTKKKSIKDTVTHDEFEVAIFLTDTNTRHSLLYKQKHFRDKMQTKLASNSSKLVGASSEAPIDVEDADFLGEGDGVEEGVPQIRREDSGENDVIALENIPSIDEDQDLNVSSRPKRKRNNGGNPVQVDDSDDDLFVAQEDKDGHNPSSQSPPAKRQKDGTEDTSAGGPGDDKKKMAMDISYQGFAIYGRVLCLVVKKRGGGLPGRGRAGDGTGASRSTGGAGTQLGGQASMENWISSTQVPTDAADDMDGS